MNVGVVVLGEIFNDRTWGYSLFGVVRLGVNGNGKRRCTGTAETTDRGLGQEVKETQRCDLRQEGEAEEVEVEHGEAGRWRGSRRGATTPWRFGHGKETESRGSARTDGDAVAVAKAEESRRRPQAWNAGREESLGPRRWPQEGGGLAQGEGWADRAKERCVCACGAAGGGVGVCVG